MTTEQANIPPTATSALADFIAAYLPEAFVVLDQRGVIVFVSSCFKQMFCSEQEEFLGLSFERFVPQVFTVLRDMSYEENLCITSDIKTSVSEVVIDTYGLLPDGSSFPISATLASVRTREGIGSVVVVHSLSAAGLHE